MAQFEYNTTDSEGRPVHGRIEADDLADALAKLAAQGLSARAEELVVLDDADQQQPPKLSGSQTTELVEMVADLTAADLPLSAGLRATADEMPQRRVASAMRLLADQLDRGVSLDAALQSAASRVPAYLRGLILAGLRTGRVAYVLEELVAMDRARAEMRRRIAVSLIYPVFLLLLVAVLFPFIRTFILVPFTDMFEEFGVNLPGLTLMFVALMEWFDATGVWSAGLVVLVLLPAGVLLAIVPKPPEVQRACYMLPIIGPLWRWQSLVEFCHLMHLLLDRQVSLVDALRWTGDGLRWSDLAQASRACAIEVEAGIGLVDALAAHREFPPSMRPVIESGMIAQEPAQAFAAAADMYRQRAGVDATLWEVILPPIILLFASTAIGFAVVAMLLPMFKLISSLS